MGSFVLFFLLGGGGVEEFGCWALWGSGVLAFWAMLFLGFCVFGLRGPRGLKLLLLFWFGDFRCCFLLRVVFVLFGVVLD